MCEQQIKKVCSVFSPSFLDGLLLTQNQPSVTKMQSTTARIECKVEGVSSFTYFYLHWYQQLPSRPLKRIMYMGSGSSYYDDDSLRYKFSSEKRDANVYILSVNDVNSNNEGTYYCASWQYHRISRPQTACTESCLYRCVASRAGIALYQLKSPFS